MRLLILKCLLIVPILCSQLGCSKMESKPVKQNAPKESAPIAPTSTNDHQGQWSVTSATMAGKPFPEDFTKTISLTLDGDQYDAVVAGKPDKGTYVVDAKHSPARMTITGTEGPNKGKTFLTIFDFPKKDQMRICYDLSGKEFPAEFESTTVNNLYLVQYSRKNNSSPIKKAIHKKEKTMTCPIVSFDIAGNDDAALKTFYSSIFGWDADQNGQFSVKVSPSIIGTIRKDPAEKRIYIGVSDISAVLAQIKESGGTVDAPRFEVPGIVVLGLFKDPAGNPMGLIEMDGDNLRVP